MLLQVSSPVFHFNDKKSRCFRWLSLAIGGLLSGSSLFGVVELGHYGAIAADVEAGVEYSSNIALNSLESDDFIFNFKPLLRYRFNEGMVRVEAYAGYNIRRYDAFDNNDAEDVVSQLVIDFPYGEYGNQKRYDLRLEAGYNESTSANASVQAITAVEKINLSVIGRYYVSERTYLRSGFAYLDRQSQTLGFDDINEITIPLEFFYDYSEDLSYGVGYRYKATDLSGAAPRADSEDHAIFLAAVGQVAPSVTAEVRIGGQKRKFDATVYDDETGFFMESSLLWSASDLTVIELSVGNVFDSTIGNQSKETLFGEIRMTHEFAENLRAFAGLGYEDVEYTKLLGERDDQQWSMQLGGIYTLIEERLELDARVGYAERESSKVGSTYEVFNAKFSISYLF